MCYARRQRSSWARIKLSKSLYQNILSDDSILLSSLALSFFTFVWVVFSFKELFEIRFAHTYMLCTSLLLFNFQGSFAAACAATLLLYHFFPRLSIPFLKVFSTFFKFLLTRSESLQYCHRSRGQLTYSITFIPVCQEFFYLFSSFFIFLSLCIVLYDNLYDIVVKKSTKHTKNPFVLPI